MASVKNVFHNAAEDIEGQATHQGRKRSQAAGGMSWNESSTLNLA